MTTSMKDKSFWITETFSGGTEFRTRSKVLLTILSFVFAGLLYQLLIVIEGFPGGSEIIIALAYGVIVLMAALMLLVIIVAIVEYLRRFEK